VARIHAKKNKKNQCGSLGFRMVEPKSTVNSANSREKNKKISVICVIRGKKFTSWYTHHAKSQKPYIFTFSQKTPK